MGDSQTLFLQRQWALLDGNKQLRSLIPTVSCTLIASICAFYFGSNGSQGLSNVWWLFLSFYAGFGVAGIAALYGVHVQYKYSNEKIEFLYDKFGLDFLVNFDYPNKERYEEGEYLFLIAYLAILFFAGVASLATYLVDGCTD